MEKRRTVRVPIKPIPVLFYVEERASQGEILNLSKKGLFVRSLEIPPVDTVVRVVFKNRQGQKVEVTGVVRWTTNQLRRGLYHSPGFGMLFTDWNDAYHDFFERVLFTSPPDSEAS